MSEETQDTNADTMLSTVSRRRVLGASIAAGVGAAAVSATPALADTGAPGAAAATGPWKNGRLTVSENGRFLQHENGTPFFWTADTAWLLHKLSRQEIPRYFGNRQQKQFNVVLLQVIPASLDFTNYYGDSPFIDNNVRQPNPPYWNHVSYMVAQAAASGIYLAMDAVWRQVVKDGHLSADDATWYGQWLAARYKDSENVVWLNGGDAIGTEKMEVWLSLAEAIRKEDPNHLMTFHPNGRFSSSTWFNNESWLDFNMFQSGHRNYEQTYQGAQPSITGVDLATYWKAEDNWMYVQGDYNYYPAKPTLDGEPSYEHIHQGIYDFNLPFWNDADVRRYAYWSVFGGSCGHTYGNGGVMPMHVKTDPPVNGYGVSEYWYQTMDDPGAGQMRHLQNLMLSRPYFQRIPEPTAIVGDPGYRHDRVLATRGEDFLFAYIHTGRAFSLQLGLISGDKITAWWYDPRTGKSSRIGTLDNTGTHTFDPPGATKDGNDWVLVLDDAAQQFGKPGETPYQN
ncbi:MAG TPA: glycoside hydrolase family 140 protein [Microlunatus sp.]